MDKIILTIQTKLPVEYYITEVLVCWTTGKRRYINVLLLLLLLLLLLFQN